MPIELHGATRIYRADFAATNAKCDVEEATGLRYSEVLRELRRRRPKVSILRAFVRAALLDPPDATPEEVGAIIDDIGGQAAIQAAIEPATQRRKGKAQR